MKNKQSKNKLGPLVKITLPKFNFQEVQKQEKNLEEIIQSANSQTNQHLLNKKIEGPQKTFSTRNLKQSQKAQKSVYDFPHMQKQQKEAFNLMQQQKISNNNSLDFKDYNYQLQQNKSLAYQRQLLKQHNKDCSNNQQLPPIQDSQIYLNKLPVTKSLETQKFFKDKGYDTNKFLKNYDCWNEKITPQMWIEKCKNPGPHAVTPLFDDGKYIWKEVSVLEYDQEIDRYKVQLKYIENKQERVVEKYVVRLSLMFHDEDPNLFKERVEIAKLRQQTADDEIRFQKYLESIDDQIVAAVGEPQSTLIIERVLQGNRKFFYINQQTDLGFQWIKQDNQHFQQKLENITPQKKQLLDDLMNQVRFEYLLFQKKSKIVKEMIDEKNSVKWAKLRIKMRENKQEKVIFGLTVQHNDFRFKEVQEIIQKRHSSNKIKIVKTLNKLQKRTEEYQNFCLFKTKWDRNHLPIDYKQYEFDQRNIYKNGLKTLQANWRQNLTSEITDTMSGDKEKQKSQDQEFKFYSLDLDKYNDSELKKYINKFDFMFNTYVRNIIVDFQLKDYVSFLKCFTIPSDEEKNIWSINDYPLIIVTLNINTKKKKTKDKEKEDYITFEPTIQQIQETLLLPLELLIEATNSFHKLETHLVPLLDIEKQPSYEISSQLDLIQQANSDILSFIEQGYVEPKEILEQFKQYNFIIEQSKNALERKLFFDSKEQKENKVKESPDILKLDYLEIQKILEQFSKAKSEIQRLCLDQKNGRFFQVKTAACKEVLIEKAQEIIDLILSRITIIIKDNTTKLQENYNTLKDKLTKIPTTEDELVVLKNLINNNKKDLDDLKEKVDQVYAFMLIQEDYIYEYKKMDQIMINFWELRICPAEIKDCLIDGRKNATTVEEKLLLKLENEKDNFIQEFQKLKQGFEEVQQFKDHEKVTEIIKEIMEFQDKINQAKSKVDDFNRRELIFKQPQTDYDELSQLSEQFQPYQKLWMTGNNFQQEKNDTRQGNFLKLNYKSISDKITEQKRDINQLAKIFDSNPDQDIGAIPKAVADTFKEQIKEFEKDLWLIQELTTEAMTTYKKPLTADHWKNIVKLAMTADMKKQLEINDDLTLEMLLEYNLNNFQQEIMCISKQAQKEYEIEKKMKDMEDEIKKQVLQLNPAKNDPNTFVLSGIDDLQQKLDDNLNLLQLTKAGITVPSQKRTADALEKRIMLIQDTLDQWIKVQRGWMYLQPIFMSDDIRKQLPAEKLKFDNIDKHWRDTMEKWSQEEYNRVYEGIDTDKLKNDFFNSNQQLDKIQKSLSEYLETKQGIFSRFYFLSDEELLEILADTKDPLKVQKHINKCFEAINKLYFDPKNKNEVSGMVSAEDEQVMFNKPINVVEGERKGNVELWLLAIEKMMIATLKTIIGQSYKDQQKRTDWVRKWPGQIVLAVNMVRWTMQAEEAINNQNGEHKTQGFQNLIEYFDFLEQQLFETVDLVRQNLSQLERLTLGSLVVLDVHAKDTIESLKEKGCSSIQEFSWISNLRYYWQDKKEILDVKMINASLKYGFEYLGNSNRLVITPLTDRCYRTLMGAYHLMYGGAPEGPAGTGKTETTKDLGKACAVQCVVFNCSDGINYLTMRKFFKGLASSGAWCCFDEFNRINLEVLSVIAQQILSIQYAIKAKFGSFNFEGRQINLNPACAINITMNPGYAGRSELPDNLKSLFRSCAMMVPDYAMIAEIYLYSVGFKDARTLSCKIVASLRLSSEQLSSQGHYDFGMRALKAILTAAGNLKRTLMESEDIVCLRSLMDVNIPKFTINDVPLFMSITSDLFPGVKLPDIDYGILLDGLNEAAKKLNLIDKSSFTDKCIQLYDTINVRHGLMIVGSAACGKTSIIEVLRLATNNISKITDEPKAAGFKPTNIIKMNPKAVTSDQLYGKLDPDTKQWTDGIVAISMRNCTQVAPEFNNWILFDGPVDAVWIENLNTVLDDNKKLCLTSGEIIKLTNHMTILFEVEDLAYASPATVSRCGMVFMEGQNLGWQPLIQSFVGQLRCPEEEEEKNAKPNLFKHNDKLFKYKDFISKQLLYLIDPVLAFNNKNSRFNVHNSEQTFVANILKLLKLYFNDFPEPGQGKKHWNNSEMEEIINSCCIFAVVWGLGGVIDDTSRAPFSEFFSLLLQCQQTLVKDYDLQFFLQDQDFKVNQEINIPSLDLKRNSIFDYCYVIESNQFKQWVQTVDKFLINKSHAYNQLFFPTKETIRNDFFIDKYISNQQHFLICGSTGTGKTVTILRSLNDKYFNADYSNCATSFSGETTANQIQLLIESKVNTRRSKGVFGPEDSKKHMVIFIDDLNMPIKEIYGAQPPIEVLRQWMDTKSFYDLETKEKKELINITFIHSMLPLTSGRNVITMRYMRHLQLLYLEAFESDSLKKIFGQTLQWYFMNQNGNVNKAIENLSDKIITGTIAVYNRVCNCTELRPTPVKSHYVYNLRDISKVYQGISKSTFRSYKTENDFIKLWIHECQRIFKDRLINIQDREFFDVILDEILKKNFKVSFKELVPENIFFTHFVPQLDENERKIIDVYMEVKNKEDLIKVCYEQLEEYNSFYIQNKMDLVLFVNAIEHVLNLVRVITTSFGHALLVGVGGSGRKSLATLATFIAFQLEPIQIDQKNWVEEMQKVLKTAGIDQKDTVFLFSDTQIIKESMVEEICNLLNNGEIPSLFNSEEKAILCQELNLDGGINKLYQLFVEQCKEKLHLVLAFSPVGNQFRRRLRTFPALVNCTTIDWYLDWPTQALIDMGQTNFNKDFAQFDESIHISLTNICVNYQLDIAKLSKRYLSELRRYYYVTPTSYLELLHIFKEIYYKRQNKIYDNIKRYQEGVKKIVQTENDVEKMAVELRELEPLLKIKTEENTKLRINLQKQQKDADIKKDLCEKEEEESNKLRDAANKLKADCTEELDKVLPLLAKGEAALNEITAQQIDFIKHLVVVKDAIIGVMEGIIYAFDEAGNVKKVPKEQGSMEKVFDWWDYSKKKVLNGQFLKRVKGFKQEQIKAISGKNIQKMKDLLSRPEVEESKVRNSAEAAAGLLNWLKAVVETYDALLIVGPKEIQVAEAEAELKAAEEQLASKKAALQEVIDKLQELQRDFDLAKKEKDELENKVDKCQKHKRRADELIDGLGGEKKNWQQKALDLTKETTTLTGDCVLSSGIIAYLGAFPITYRKQTINEWTKRIQNENIQISNNYSFQSILCDPITIGQWTNQFKLPNDSFSIDNGIIMKNSNRWPLMIDPQGQANQWIKMMDQIGDKYIIRPAMLDSKSINRLLQTLEQSIINGNSVLLENIGEEIDANFDSILQKKIVKEGRNYKIKFIDKFVQYNENFRFYMTTKLTTPHYSPETCVKVTVLNFQVTPEGLEDQMLNIIVAIEEQQKYQQREKNIIDFFANKEQQKRTEDKILQLLFDANEDLLEDEVLIETLSKSKIESHEIEEKLRKQEHDQKNFMDLRNSFVPIGRLAANLYFVLMDLPNIVSTYIFSLESYIKLFKNSIQVAAKGENKAMRCENINDKLQKQLYESVCRALFTKHKLVFSFLMVMKILEISGNIDDTEKRFMMVGATWVEGFKQDLSQFKWLSQKIWANICELSEFDNFKGIDKSIIDDNCQWEVIYQSEQPEKEEFPKSFSQLTNFQKLIILKIIRPDKFSSCIQWLITKELSDYYIQPPQFNLLEVFGDTDAFAPLIFVLSPGADPRQEIENLAQIKGTLKSGFKAISLGQGQGEIAIKSVQEAKTGGKWILLENCHLATSFMPDLEKLLDNINPSPEEEVDPNFRIWLTCMPSDTFPPSILMKGVKMTFEPPKGLKSHLLRNFSSQTNKTFEDCVKPESWKKLFFGLAFFHGLILERRSFGPLGWNIPYEFTPPDFQISFNQLKIFLNEYEEIPYQAINYMVAEANYGGRVTDPMDRRLIKILLQQFYTPEILDDTYKFSPSGIYYAPDANMGLEQFKEYIQELPWNDPTEVFGLHENAAISSAIINTNEICQTVLNLLPRSVGGKSGKSEEEIMKEKINNILDDLPELFNLEVISQKHKILYEQSMNTVLQQELIRFNNLLNIVRNSLKNLGDAIDGLLAMSQELEDILDSILNNRQPDLWSKKAYPSLKPLGSWIIDFIKRLQFFQKWVDEGIPETFWVSGFFFTQSFLTGTLQNFARKYSLPIDTLQFEFEVCKEDQSKAPENGCYIYGLWLDGARWDSENHCINEQYSKELYSNIPYIWMIPTDQKQNFEEMDDYYCCPVYKTSKRAGVLTTTGHSSNFVITAFLPIHKDHNPNHWVKRGVAALSQLDD